MRWIPVQILEFLEKYSSLFSFGYTVLAALFGFLVGKIPPKMRAYKIKKCLSLGKRSCKIILPNYHKKLHNPKDSIEVCPVGDIMAASNLIDLIHSTGLYTHQQSIFYEGNYSEGFEKYNIFCVGGSLANAYSYDLFRKFFPKFKILATEEKIRRNPLKIPPDHFVVSERKGFCWGDSPEEAFFIDASERYAILVKLSEDDFRMKNHGTVHILFGNGIEGTLALSKYLLNDYTDLYKRVGRKRHYFLAFKVKRDTGMIIPNSFVDLTDKLFSQKM